MKVNDPQDGERWWAGEFATDAQETPYHMSLNIRKHMRGLMADGRHNIRRKKAHGQGLIFDTLMEEIPNNHLVCRKPL